MPPEVFTRIGKSNDLARFRRDCEGNVAMMFALCFVAILGSIGLVVDYSRQSMTQASLQSVVDSVALAAAQEAGTVTAAQLNANAQRRFDALAAGGPSAGLRVNATYSTTPARILTASASGEIASLFGSLFNVGSMHVAAQARVPISTKPAEIVLVMDNTGSMSGNRKLQELKTAATNLVDSMKAAAGSGDTDIRIALVPFAKSVKIGDANSAAPWLDWSSYRGRHANWEGCVDDRDQPHDVTASAPNGDTSTWYPVSDCQLATIMPLTNDWSSLKSRIAGMMATGSTNLTIGIAWGLNMLSSGAPLSTASPTPEKFNHYMVLLTDGENTQNRWTSRSSSIDARTLAACAQVKAAGIQIFTVRVIDGNADLLRSCATSPDMFYDVREASQLSAVFDRIGATVKNALYLSR